MLCITRLDLLIRAAGARRRAARCSWCLGHRARGRVRRVPARSR